MSAKATEQLPGAPDPWAPSEMPRLRSRPPFLMTEMIGAEPALAERLARRLARDDAVGSLADALRAAADAGLPILTTGCGTSEHAAMAVASILSDALHLSTGRAVRAVQALDVLAAPPADGVLLAISHEGGTRATNEALRAARDAGARTGVVTVSRRSPAGETAEIVIETGEIDQSWCHTVGYLSPIVAGTVVAATIEGRRVDALAMRALLDTAEDPRGASAAAAALRPCDRLLVVAAGVDGASARELALKIEEGARLPAVARHLETIRHGHLASATEKTGMVLILSDAHAPDGAVAERAVATLRSAKALGMPGVAILGATVAPSVPRRLTAAGRLTIPGSRRLPPAAVATLGAAIPLQLLAERLARSRGMNPDGIGRDDPRQAAAHA